MVEQYFKTDAKQIVDMLFDAKLFKDNVTRDDMNGVEGLIQFLMQSRFESYTKCTSMMAKIEAREKQKS